MTVESELAAVMRSLFPGLVDALSAMERERDEARSALSAMERERDEARSALEDVRADLSIARDERDDAWRQVEMWRAWARRMASALRSSSASDPPPPASPGC
jgi:uncharacterized protein (DUF3084 family)